MLSATELERAKRRPLSSASSLLPTRDEYGWPEMLPILSPEDFAESSLHHWLYALFPVPAEPHTYQSVTSRRAEQVLAETAKSLFHDCLSLSPTAALDAASRDPELASKAWNQALSLLGYSGRSWYMEA